MKKSLLSLTFCISFLNFSLAQTPNYHWATNCKGAGDDYMGAHVTDSLGNIYTVVNYNGVNLDLDPGPGTFTVSGTGVGGQYRCALIKLNAAGQFVWGKKISAGGSETRANDIAIDADGNIYVAGGFSGTNIDFDPSSSSFLLSSNGALDDNFVTKYDQNGNWQWAIGFGADAWDQPTDIKISASGNVYVCGFIEGNGCDFDPGSATAILTPAGYSDGYIAKYNSSGQYQWAFLTGGTQFDNWSSLAIDANEDVYVMGSFSDVNIDMNPGAGTYYLNAQTSYGDMFIAKYSSAKIFQWAFKLASTNYNTNSGGLAFDNSGNIYATGLYNGNLDFDPGPSSNIISCTGGCGFLAKYSTSTGAYVSAGKITKVVSVEPVNDASGNLYITGRFDVATDLDPGAGNFSPTVYGAGDCYVAKYNSSLAFQWGFSLGGTNWDYPRSISVDNWANVSVSGTFSSTTIDFDPGTSTNSLTKGGEKDFFIARYSQSPDVGIKEIKSNDELSVWPNPSNGKVFINVPSAESFALTVYNSLGQIVSTFSSVKSSSEIDLRNFGNGIYNLVIKNGNSIRTAKVVVE